MFSLLIGNKGRGEESKKRYREQKKDLYLLGIYLETIGKSIYPERVNGWVSAKGSSLATRCQVYSMWVATASATSTDVNSEMIKSAASIPTVINKRYNVVSILYLLASLSRSSLSVDPYRQTLPRR